MAYMIPTNTSWNGEVWIGSDYKPITTGISWALLY